MERRERRLVGAFGAEAVMDAFRWVYEDFI